MTVTIETLARNYLLNDLNHPRYRFSTKRDDDAGFDLWLFDVELGSEHMVELKAHTGMFTRPSHLCERLIFNTTLEKDLFEQGKTVIARVFTGSNPFRVFILTNRILSFGAVLHQEPRYVLRGKMNYNDSYQEIC